SSGRTTSTTLGDVLRSVVPKRNVLLNDTARGTASTETIFNVTPRSSAHAELGVRLLGLDAGIAEPGQVDGLVVAGQQVLGQASADAERVHEAVPGEAGGDVDVLVVSGPVADHCVTVEAV